MATLQSLLNDLSTGSGMFSPLAMRSTRIKAKRVASAIPGAAATVQSSLIRAGASRYNTDQTVAGQKEITGMQQEGLGERLETEEVGKTLRQRMVNDTTLGAQRLRNKGMLDVQDLANEGADDKARLEDRWNRDYMSHYNQLGERVVNLEQALGGNQPYTVKNAPAIATPAPAATPANTAAPTTKKKRKPGEAIFTFNKPDVDVPWWKQIDTRDDANLGF